MQPTDKIKDKIKKLLALAQSPNEAEAQSAMNKAIELMQKYSIEESEVHGKKMESVILHVDFIIIPKWVIYLINGVSISAGVFCVYAHGHRGDKWRSGSKGRFYLTGRTADIENVKYIGDFLQKQILKMSEEFTKSLPKHMDGMTKQKKSKSYRIGLSAGISKRMQEITDKFFSDLPVGKDLVPVADNKQKLSEAEDLFAQNNEFKHGESSSKIDYSAMAQGTADSKKIQINHGVEGFDNHNDVMLLEA